MKSYTSIQRSINWHTLEDLISFKSFKKSKFLINATRDIKRYPKTNDKALTSQSAKLEASKQRVKKLIHENK